MSSAGMKTFFADAVLFDMVRLFFLSFLTHVLTQ